VPIGNGADVATARFDTTGMTSEPQRVDTNDRWLDDALSSAIPAHPRWLVARCVVMVLCGTAILLFVPGDGRFVAAAATALTGLLQPVVWLSVPRANRATVHACSDFVLIFFIVALEPAIWAVGLFFAGAILGWQALTAPWRTTMGLAIAALVGMTTVGILADIDLWVLGPVAVVVTIPILARLGRAIRQELLLKQSDLSLTLSSIGAVVRNFDLDTGKSLTVEGDFEALTGWTLHEWKGLDYKSLIHPDDRERYWIDADTVHDGQHVDRVARLLRPDGSWTWIRDVGLISVDHNGRRSMHGFAVDVTDIQEANQLIARQAMEDSLTGLANRRRLFIELGELNQACTPLALFMIDLDLFKKVNDSFGHEAGDHLLQFVASQLRELIGDDGLVARLGGDEFAIVCPGLTSEAETAALVAKIRSATSEPVALANGQVSISLSIGVAISAGLVDGTTLLRHADIAMYEAKEHGQPYQVFDLTLDPSSAMTLSLGPALHHGIEAEQPQL
jgi:diguanylate cyclase (GGDEF)-like protein/PAS domain S-box-containing protein